MKWNDWLEKWGMTSVKLNAGFLEMEWEPRDPDRRAAWELYVELLTRIATQPLPDQEGDEQTALDSVYSLFSLTRTILKDHPGCMEFAKLAIAVLNQILRPFTAKWHRKSLAGAFQDPTGCAEFRRELEKLQEVLRNYTQALAAMANVEDLTALAPKSRV